MANHPLLSRNNYSDEQIQEIAALLIENDFDNVYIESDETARRRGTKPKTERECLDDLIQDMYYYSDFEIHQLCEENKPLKSYLLSEGNYILRYLSWYPLIELLTRLLPSFPPYLSLLLRTIIWIKWEISRIEEDVACSHQRWPSNVDLLANDENVRYFGTLPPLVRYRKYFSSLLLIIDVNVMD